MKIVIAGGGLGNTMFNYALVVAFRKLGIRSILFVSDANIHHNGYELEKIFSNVNPFLGISSITRHYYLFLGYIRCLKLSSKMKFPHRLLLFPFKRLYISNAYSYCSEVFTNLQRNEYLIGVFQSYKYYECCKNELIKEFSFDELKLSTLTKTVANRIKETSNAVSIHVRRGDYMTPYFYKNLGCVCNLDYYNRAITEMNMRVKNPTYFIFSDDINYVRENLSIPNAVFIDFNIKTDSWQDMYLMSICKHNIIANSSFSWWGAYLNQNPEKVVIAPYIWWAGYDTDDVTPPSWIRL